MVEAESEREPLVLSAINLEGVKFLVVDDNPFMRSIIRHILKILGARDIFEASDGKEGYEVAQQIIPDIALVDWVMEPEDGLKFVKKIRRAEDSPNPFMPLIMVSGYSEQRHVLTARDAGVNEFVVKPLSATSLFARIQWVIERPRRFVKIDTYFGPDRRRKTIAFKGEDRRQIDQETGALVDPGEDDSEKVHLDVESKPEEDDAAAAPEAGGDDVEASHDQAS